MEQRKRSDAGTGLSRLGDLNLARVGIDAETLHFTEKETRAYRIIRSCTNKAQLQTATLYCENFALQYGPDVLPALMSAIEQQRTKILHGLADV